MHYALADPLRTGVRKLKRLGRVALGKDRFFHATRNVALDRIGSKYGGWDVAIRCLPENPVVFSFGLGTDISFDLEMITRFQARISGFDPTPRSLEWLAAQSLPDSFTIFDRGIAAQTGTVVFYPPKDDQHVSHSVACSSSVSDSEPLSLEVLTVEDAMKVAGESYIDILKMDIEGSEYEVLDWLRHSSIRPGQILVEFHHRFSCYTVDQTESSVRQLESIGYDLVSVSETNEEFGFLRKDMVQKVECV